MQNLHNVIVDNFYTEYSSQCSCNDSADISNFEKYISNFFFLKTGQAQIAVGKTSFWHPVHICRGLFSLQKGCHMEVFPSTASGYNKIFT